MEPIRDRRWICRIEQPEVFLSLAEALGIKPLVARVLGARGICTPDEGRRFLEGRLSDLPDPFLMKGMAEAVARLSQALEAREPIAIHGDYDVDGITGTALLMEGLQRMGAITNYHIPLRLIDGYGLSLPAFGLGSVGCRMARVWVGSGGSVH